MKDEYHNAVSRLAQKQSGWHFGALYANAEQLEEVRIEDMAPNVRALPLGSHWLGYLRGTCVL